MSIIGIIALSWVAFSRRVIDTDDNCQYHNTAVVKARNEKHENESKILKAKMKMKIQTKSFGFSSLR